MKSRSLNFITSVSPGPASINGRAKIMMTVLFLMYQWIALVGSSSVLQNIICSSNYLFPFHLVALHPWGKGWYSHFAPHFLLLILIMCREHRTKKQTDSSINCKYTNSLLPFWLKVLPLGPSSLFIITIVSFLNRCWMTTLC